MVNNLIVETSVNNKERGLTSIIISHNVEASLKISDFIAFLDNGKIIDSLRVVKGDSIYIHYNEKSCM